MQNWTKAESADRSFVVVGKEVTAEPLAWSVCGLPILLLNGFRRETVDGEEAVAVDNLDGLWAAVGLYLVKRKKHLTGLEARVLRRHMNLTQAELGHLLRVSDQTVARWEKSRSHVTGPADFALRTAYLLMKSEPELGGAEDKNSWLQIIKELADEDDVVEGSLTIRCGRDGWEQPRPTLIAA